jgi:voltage-gated potassium channel
MDRKRNMAWLSYKRESFRYGLYSKRLGMMLLINLTLTVFIASLLILLFEKRVNPDIKTYWDAIWLVFISLATIGYGDIVPVTAGGKLVIFGLMIVGVGTISAYVAGLATRRVARAKRRYNGLEGKTKSSDHVVICGWNSRGPYVIERLKSEMQNEHRPIILLADLNEKPLEDEYIFFFQGSPVSETDLRRTNIAAARSAILLADDTKGGTPEDIDSRTVLTALTIRALSPTLKMTAEVLKPENINHLKLAEVEEILDSDMVLGNLIARSALHYGLIGVVTEMVTRKENMRIFSIPVEEGMAGKSSEEIVDRLRDSGGGKLIGIITQDGFISYDQPYTVKPEDRLLMIAEQEPDGGDEKLA